MSIASQKAKVTAATFGAKYTSKREIYSFLSTEANTYLPGIETVTIWHLRDLAQGSRRRISSQEVLHVSVPQFKGLAIKHMLEYAEMHPEVLKALPTGDKEIEKLPR